MLTGKQIMIVEDSQTVRYQVNLMMKDEGVSLIEAGNEMGMFNAIESFGKKVDLVIMDLTLKNENGFDLIAKLKKDFKYSDIPILVLTESADVNNVLKAKEMQVAGFLRKPFTKDDLLKKVNSILV